MSYVAKMKMENEDVTCPHCRGFVDIQQIPQDELDLAKAELKEQTNILKAAKFEADNVKIEQRWPGLLEFGEMLMKCKFNIVTIRVCAEDTIYMGNINGEEVTDRYNNIRNDKERLMKEYAKQAWPIGVYGHYVGLHFNERVLQLHEAAFLSLHSEYAQELKPKLKDIFGICIVLKREKVTLMNQHWPGILKFADEKMPLAHMSIGDAALNLLNPYLESSALENELKLVAHGFSQNFGHELELLRAQWPMLAEFKDVQTFSCTSRRGSITDCALICLNRALQADAMCVYLDQLEGGFHEIEGREDELIHEQYPAFLQLRATGFESESEQAWVYNFAKFSVNPKLSDRVALDLHTRLENVVRHKLQAHVEDDQPSARLIDNNFMSNDLSIKTQDSVRGNAAFPPASDINVHNGNAFRGTFSLIPI